MNCKEFQAGSVGVEIEVPLVQCDGTPFPRLADAVTTQLVFKLGTRASVTKTATIKGDAEDAVLTYTTTSGDFATPGLWNVQPKLTYSGAAPLYGEVVTFRVKANL